MPSNRTRETGAAAVEYVGMVVVAALLIGVLTAVVAPAYVAARFGYAVCILTTDGKACALDPAGPGVPESASWYDKATWGSAWFGGDSYASGEGAGDYQEGTDEKGNAAVLRAGQEYVPKDMCHRSKYSYQAQVFRSLQDVGAFTGDTYTSYACSGSTVPNLYSPNQQGNNEGPQAQTNPGSGDPDEQFNKIPADASLITLSMGGNDVGFADVVTNCVTGFLGSGCGDSAAIQTKIDGVFGSESGSPGSMETQVKKMREQHPNARIIIMGYPQMLAETDGAVLGMSVDEQRWANQQAVALNRSIKAMCERQGVEFVDPNDLFVGTNPDGSSYDHRIGSKDSWFTPLGSVSDYLSQSAFHPNRAGQDAMAARLLQHVKNGPKR